LGSQVCCRACRPGIRVGTIGLAYIIRGGKDHQVYAEVLVTGGIYAHTRNPMYLGNAFLLAGLAIASNSWLVATLGVAIALAWHAAIIAAEEDFLRAKFGAQFDRIARRCRGIFRSSWARGHVPRMRFDWRRVLMQEYAKPFDWVAAIALVVLVNLWRADLVDVHRVLAAVLLVIIVARLALWMIALHLKTPARRLRGLPLRLSALAASHAFVSPLC
jgi:hypothetical protein